MKTTIRAFRISVLLFAAAQVDAIPNPSAEFCVKCGYQYQIRTDSNGGQYGVCIFPDGSEREAWAFYRKCNSPQPCGDCNCPWPCPARIISVDDDGPADFNNIQDAIDASKYGDTILVAPGRYTESVAMKDGVCLQGSGAEVTTIDGHDTQAVVKGASNSRLDGFTITGYAHEDIDGVYCENVEGFTISHNIIKNNTWSGINVLWSSVTISNNLILNNICAGIFCRYQSPTTILIINNTICENHNDAGINIWEGAQASVVNNIITGNTGYGGIYCWNGTATLVRNDVWGNSCLFLPNADYVGCEPGETDISVDPLYADPPNGDYHLKSRTGRWDLKTQSWIKDNVTSPCIDAGDPMSPIGLEPFPNGGRVNMGAYGGTAEASKSYFGEPVCETIIAGDINGDCKVNLLDLAILAEHWASDAGATEPFEIMLGNGAKWSPQYEGYDPYLPGYHVVGDIASITLKAKTEKVPDTLILAIQTSPGMPPMLEGFTFTSACLMLQGGPFNSVELELFERPDPSAQWQVKGKVRTDEYFIFKVIGGEVRITFLPKTIRLMKEQCNVSWIDWYRR